MIDKDLLRQTVLDAIAGSDLFVVDIRVAGDNDIAVELDSPSGVDLDTCALVTRKIEEAFDRDKEDYSLEVGSASITDPFKVPEQYAKYLGKEVEVLTADGKKLTGTLAEVDGAAGTFTVEVPTKVKAPGAKRASVEMVPHALKMGECKYVKYHLVFK